MSIYSARLTAQCLGRAGLACSALLFAQATSAASLPASAYPSARPAAAEGEERSGCADMPPNAAIGIAEAMMYAICTSPNVKRALLGVTYQRSNEQLAAAAQKPALTATQAWNRSHYGYRIQDAMIGYDVNLRNVNSNVGLAWVLYDFGHRSASRAAARELTKSATATYWQEIQRVGLAAGKRFIDVTIAADELAAQDAAIRLAEQALEVAKAKLVAGTVSIADQMLADTQLAELSAERSALHSSLLSARGALASIVGLAPDVAIATKRPGATVRMDKRVLEPYRDISTAAIKQHPAVLAAAAEVAAAKSSLSAAKASAFGTLSLVGGVDRNTQYQNQASSVTTNKSIGLEYKVAFYEGGASLARVSAALATLGAKEHELEAAHRTVSEDLWKSYLGVSEAQAQMTASALLVQTADNSYTVMRARYDSGIGNAIEILSAQNALVRARRTMARAEGALWLARLTLLANLGHMGPEYSAFRTLLDQLE